MIVVPSTFRMRTAVRRDELRSSGTKRRVIGSKVLTMASGTEMRCGVRVCQWGTYHFLQSILILSLLVLISGVCGATHNELAKKDGTVVEGSFYDTASGSPTDAEVADEDNEAYDGDQESEESVLFPNDQQLTSNVELKSVSPHTGKAASGQEAGLRTNLEEAKRRYQEQQKQKEEDLIKFKQKYDKVLEEMKVASAAHLARPKKSGIYSNEPTPQERLYREHQEEVGRLSPEQKQKLMDTRRQHVADMEGMRKKYEAVVEELKQKLAEREAAQRGTGGVPSGLKERMAATGGGRPASSLRRRQGVL